MRVNHPGIAQLSGAFHRTVIVGGNPDGRMGLLDGTEFEARIHQTAVGESNVTSITSPQTLDDL